MRLRHSARTDVGQKRDHNEDDFGVGEGTQIAALGGLFIVCDGMGGHAAGEVASRIAVETALSSYYGNHSESRESALKQAFERANERIYVEGHGSMGTTGVAALFHHGQLWIANVGDSRAYLIRESTIQQISVDHSLVSDQLAAGLITPEEARSITYRNVITRALGHLPELEVDLFAVTLHEHDIIALCSDGLHGLVEDEELAASLSSQPLAHAIEQLVDLANARGGIDNITLLAIEVEDIEQSQTIELIPSAEQDSSGTESDELQLGRRSGGETAPVVALADSSAIEAEEPTTPQEGRLTILSAAIAGALLILLIGIFYIGGLNPGLAPVTPGMIIPATSTSAAPAPVQSPSAQASPQSTASTVQGTKPPASIVPIVPTSTPGPTAATLTPKP